MARIIRHASLWGHGNSTLSICIPKFWLDLNSLGKGDKVSLIISEDTITIRRAPALAGTRKEEASE